MAQAPTPGGPGTAAAADDVKAAKGILAFRVNGELFTIAPNLVSIADRAIVRKAVGVPLGELLSSVDNDSIIVLWWLCRRNRGEIGLTIKRAEQEWLDLDLDYSNPEQFEMVEGSADDEEHGGSDDPES